MSLLSKLFGKKKNELSPNEKEQQERMWDGFDFFEKGKKLYFNKEDEKALFFFDKAFENNFIVNFPSKAPNLYSMRAGCLQGLNYDYDAIIECNKSIELYHNDCNIYFLRSISKGTIFDYEGQIADLEIAIALSKIDTPLNRLYNDDAQKKGFSSGVNDMYNGSLQMAKMDLATDIEDRKRIEASINSKDKEFWQASYDKSRFHRLSRIKKRSS